MPNRHSTKKHGIGMTAGHPTAVAKSNDFQIHWVNFGQVECSDALIPTVNPLALRANSCHRLGYRDKPMNECIHLDR